MLLGIMPFHLYQYPTLVCTAQFFFIPHFTFNVISNLKQLYNNQSCLKLHFEKKLTWNISVFCVWIDINKYRIPKANIMQDTFCVFPYTISKQKKKTTHLDMLTTSLYTHTENDTLSFNLPSYFVHMVKKPTLQISTCTGSYFVLCLVFTFCFQCKLKMS